jgi:hypothetical protein
MSLLCSDMTDDEVFTWLGLSRFPVDSCFGGGPLSYNWALDSLRSAPRLQITIIRDYKASHGSLVNVELGGANWKERPVSTIQGF